LQRRRLRQNNALAIAIGLLVCNLIAPRHAAAQTPRSWQIGAGYQFLHQSVDRGGENFPFGVYGDFERTVAANHDAVFSWMGQFEGGFRRDNGFSEQLFTLLGGIRASTSKPLRWTPSGFGLLGVAIQNASCADFCVGTSNGFAFQGGFAMSTTITPSTLLDITFKATKLTTTPGVFDAAIAAGIRFDLR
jgi:hypothetical protein